ncbi:hypothetical protein [Pseudogulbenkiania ferrooxidans]|uniref:Uncharacterized protein n=1 Tax=Pseudogulbenkiania ferrooxidans 2002 TaxID=279714 RepID=B9Z857_9NEIS|nr:hypothetical protein [Pseudogulbenkiania ferrooxidans]EEG07112.1 hypothetical protein FuraDRAFT_3543 [Pseudogulbenkiania ferrooxidans 2002]
MAHEIIDTPETAESKPIKAAPALVRSQLKLREAVSNHWRVIVGKDVTRERLCQSDFWSIVSRDFTPYDEIAVASETGRFYARLLVLSAGQGYCDLYELEYHELPVLLAPVDSMPNGYDIFYAGPEKGWCCKRLVDGVLMFEGETSKQSAVNRLLDHGTFSGR